MRELLLRRFTPDDAPAVRAAIDESLDEVQRWLPWGSEEPSTMEHLVARLTRYANDFGTGTAWRFAITDARDGAFIGSGALLAYPGPGALEVGYWIRRGAAGQGLATRVAAALVRHAFIAHHVTRMELWTRAGNEPSIAIAKKLGFVHRERAITSRAGGAPDDYEIFDLPSLGTLAVPDDGHVTIVG